MLVGTEVVAVGPVHAAGSSGIPPPTWQGLPAGLEVVRGHEVGGQVEHGPPQSHGPVLGPDVFGDGVKGAEGGNPDPLWAEEKSRAEGLRAGQGEEPQGLRRRDRAQEPLPPLRGTSRGVGTALGRAARRSPAPRPPRCGTAGGVEAASRDPEASREWHRPRDPTAPGTRDRASAGSPWDAQERSAGGVSRCVCRGSLRGSPGRTGRGGTLCATSCSRT